MFMETVNKMELNKVAKTIMYQMAKVFEEHLPETLYMTQYELEDLFGFTHRQWQDFLKVREIDRLVENEIAAIAEIGARRALQRLQSGEASSQDIQAARELLANSKLLKQKTNQHPQIVVTRIPEKEKEVD